MLKEGVPHEGDPHAVAADVEGGYLLVQLQDHIGSDALDLADLLCPGAGVVAGAQEDKRFPGEILQRDAGEIRLQVPVLADVLKGQLTGLVLLIGGKRPGHRQKKGFLRQKMRMVDGFRELAVVDHQIQGAPEQLIHKLWGVRLYQMDLHQRVLPGKTGDHRRQDIRSEKITPADGDLAGLQFVEIVKIIFKPVLDLHDLFHRADIMFPALCKLDGAYAAVKDGRADFLLHLFDGGAQRRLADIKICRSFGKASLFVDFINVLHGMEHGFRLPVGFYTVPL